MTPFMADAAHDDLRGNAGDDLIYGRQGADEIRGRKGNDVLRGNRGDDYIVGGQDTINGGQGNDDCAQARSSQARLITVGAAVVRLPRSFGEFDEVEVLAHQSTLQGRPPAYSEKRSR